MSKHTLLIGVAGRSGSGKSELAHSIARWLPGGAPIVALDSYYHPLCQLSAEERSKVNFDHPDALDWPLIEQHVRLLASGCAIEEPIYDFARHTRTGQMRRVEPGRCVVLEGILALHSEAIRRLLDVRIFVSTPDRVCLERRLARDIVERGRTRECVLNQYERTVRPMAEKFVDPTRAFAHLVVAGDAPRSEMLARVSEFLNTGSMAAAAAV